jgi:glycosyltransferase involved in cell wall biosynthesis
LIPADKRTAFFTICSKNYVHYARVWAKSLATHHPDADAYLYLADRSDGHIDPAVEPFSVVEASELCIPDFERFSFRYDIMEFNTAIKPYCFSDLMRRDYQNVVYMDPDTRIYDQLDDVLSTLDGGATAVLTPHALSPNENRQPPNDFTFLRSGIYNLGFLALRKTAKVRELVEWWERRLVSYCVSNRLGDGLFVDQKWVDLWPAYCPGTVILHHPGYNVAYWNLDERELQVRDGRVTVNQMPLKFFHYSGIEPGNRSVLSKHQNRLTMTSLGEVAAALFEDYHDDLDRNGRSIAKGWPYAYGTFSNGEQIPAVARWLHREQMEEYSGDPFSNAVALLNGPAGISPNPSGIVTRMSHYLWLARADLREAFPLRDRLSQVQYSQWFVDRAPEEARMPDCLVAPVRQRLTAMGEEVRRTSRRRGLRVISRPVRKAAQRAVRYVGRILRTTQPARLIPDSTKMEGGAEIDRQSSGQGVKYTSPFANDPSELSDGIAIIGYAYGESGVGEALRSLARSAVAADIPTEVCNFDVHVRARQNDRSIEGLVVNRLSKKVNVLSVNADMLPESMSIMGPAAFAGRYNIVRPFWELSNISQRWIPALEEVDEVWAPTTFVKDAFAKSLHRPVFHIPVAVNVPTPRNPSRESFGLPDGKFLFLFSFDLGSYWKRKNPDTVVEAFYRAFDSSHPDVALVIKTMGRSNDRVDTLDRLRRRVGSDPRVCFIDEVLDRARTIDLTATCDAFVSLHRAEGFGFGMAEAMSLGKPVIGTDYSGSTDFLSERTGYPVRYELVPVGDTDYPYYQIGQVWADPDVNHASERMREVYENQSQASFVGQTARQFILDNHSPAAVGEAIRDRLQTLGLLKALQPLKDRVTIAMRSN